MSPILASLLSIFPNNKGLLLTGHSFHLFFNQVDNFRTDYFLWVTAGGAEASRERSDRTEKVPKALEAELGDEADGVVEEGT